MVPGHHIAVSRSVSRARITGLFSLALLLAGGTAAAQAADCILNPHSIARLGAPAKGMIESIMVERGDRVAEGDVLVRLESSSEENVERLARMKAENETAIELARKRAEVAEAKADRLTQLGKQRITAKGDVEEAVLEAEAARLQEEQARIDKAVAQGEAEGAASALRRKTVRAPFAGVITERRLSPGELYNEQEPILVLARTDPLYAETYLPSSALKDVRPGMQVRLELETGGTATGTVTVIDPVLDSATGTFGVRIEVPNPDNKILAGQRCSFALGGS